MLTIAYRTNPELFFITPSIFTYVVDDDEVEGMVFVFSWLIFNLDFEIVKEKNVNK